MEIQWTRMAGQWPTEASPLVADFTRSGKFEILVLNRGGQLMLWTADGVSIGTGQDGLVAQLPDGHWTTTPTLVDATNGIRLLVASAEGLVVGLDEQFKPVWQDRLGGETSWGRATPAHLSTGEGSAYAFGDSTGTVSIFAPSGKLLYTNYFGAGPIKAPLQTFRRKSGEQSLLVAAGSTLICLSDTGDARWQRDLGKEISTRPEVLSLPDRKMILCGTVRGLVFALDPDGSILWERDLGEALNHSIAFLPRADAGSLIIVSGVWGNLHAVDLKGRPVWTHSFRTKTRATPLVIDANGDGTHKIFLPTFHQHVYSFDANGNMADDIRLSGILPSALTPIVDSGSGRTDFLVTTTTLLAYRLRPGPPKPQYGKTGEPRDVRLTWLPPGYADERAALGISNPHGALIKVNLEMTDSDGWRQIVGSLTGRSEFELRAPDMIRDRRWSMRATATDAAGNVVADGILPLASSAESVRSEPLRAWPTEPYASFSDSRLAPFTCETAREQKITLQNLYQDEFDQCAFIIASTQPETTRARITLGKFVRGDGTVFGGKLLLREVMATGSVNGEQVPDALPKLGDAGLVAIPGQRASKIWLSVDTHGSIAGVYSGNINISPLNQTNRIDLPMTIEVLNLRLPKEFPITFCTWDYVPNRWFPDRPNEVLDDMARHGVNIFPRSTIPPARVDAAGNLTIQWETLDVELDRLQGRGKILFHLNQPPVKFAGRESDAEKRDRKIEYILAFRDHLREHGRGYADYAFYLLDEPGLDYGVNLHILVDSARLFRAADPKLLTYTDPVAGLSWKDFEQIEPLVDVWAPNMRLVAGLLSGDPRVKRIMEAKTVWSYECVSQVKSLSPLLYNRANAWRAKFFGLGGIGFWTHSTTEADHWFAGKTFNDEYALVYPGDLPVPSVRWEAVRDGLEDASAIALLEQASERHRQSPGKQELVHRAEDALRIALRDVMEMSDEIYLESRDFLREGNRVLWHTPTDVETFRRHRAKIARLTLALDAE